MYSVDRFDLPSEIQAIMVPSRYTEETVCLCLGTEILVGSKGKKQAMGFTWPSPLPTRNLGEQRHYRT